MAEAMLNGRALGPFPVPLVLYVGLHLARALDHAHNLVDPETGRALRVVHRDVTPHNVLLNLDGDIKLSDFGVARIDDPDEDESRAGVIKGKLGYVAPEIFLARPFDHRADIWAVGVVLHEMFSQRIQQCFVTGGIRQTQIIDWFDQSLSKKSSPNSIADRARKIRIVR